MTAVQTVTIEEIIGELRAMIEHNKTNPGIIQRAFNIPLTVLYEFNVNGKIESYYFTLQGNVGSLDPGALPYDESDVVIRTTPDAVHQILDGTLSGREAVVSGRMEVIKAPSMPKLLMMRAMFNRYRKSVKGIKPEPRLIVKNDDVDVENDSVIPLTQHSPQQ